MINRAEMNASVAAAIRVGLDVNGMTQEELARITGTTLRTVARAVSGKGLPNIYNCYLFADVLGTNLDDMIRHEPLRMGQDDD